MPGNRIDDVNALASGKAWALLTYSDKSEFCFQTTLCESILRELGIVLEEGKLPRIDKQYYWNGKFIYRQFPIAGASVTLWDALTYTHRPSYELHNFL